MCNCLWKGLCVLGTYLGTIVVFLLPFENYDPQCDPALNSIHGVLCQRSHGGSERKFLMELPVENRPSESPAGCKGLVTNYGEGGEATKWEGGGGGM